MMYEQHLQAECQGKTRLSRRPAPRARPPGAEHPVLKLQRQYGNLAVRRLVAAARGVKSRPAEVSPEVEQAIEGARGGGAPLAEGVRRQMESSFGADFGGVRVHTDSVADALNQQLSARAFTTGQDIFFRQSQYDPGSAAGRELIAHELTHVVQQSGSGIRTKLVVGAAGDSYEREADAVARAVMRLEEQEAGGPVGLRAMLQRQPTGEEPTGEEEEETLELQRQPMAGAAGNNARSTFVATPTIQPCGGETHMGCSCAEPSQSPGGLAPSFDGEATQPVQRMLNRAISTTYGVIQRGCCVWTNSDCTGRRRVFSSMHNAIDWGANSASLSRDGEPCIEGAKKIRKITEGECIKQGECH